jgi:hypothetical protein
MPWEALELCRNNDVWYQEREMMRKTGCAALSRLTGLSIKLIFHGHNPPPPGLEFSFFELKDQGPVVSSLPEFFY